MADSAALDRMVRNQIEARGLRTPAVLQAMRAVPRARFVPDALGEAAYDDRPLPIGHEATISQPYIVAVMTDLARVGPGKRVLDVGTGSGYQAAVLAEIGAQVWTIERVPALADRARQTLDDLGYAVDVVVGDGGLGHPEAAPFDAIVVGAAPQRVPDALLDQLAVGGRLVIPVGDELDQELITLERTATGFTRKRQFAVLFVPLR